MAKPQHQSKLDLTLLNVDGKAHGVTKYNWMEMFRAYSHAHRKSGFGSHRVGVLINPVDTPDLWGPWIVYTLAKGIRSQAMVNAVYNKAYQIRHQHVRGNTASCNLLVPAKLPSDFDADEDDLEMELRVSTDGINREKRRRDVEAHVPTEEDKIRVNAAVRKIQHNMAVFEERNNLDRPRKPATVAPTNTETHEDEEEKLPWM